MGDMRVLHVIDNLSPGGTERQCLELVHGLSNAGVKNAVFYFRPGALLAELEQSGVTVCALPQTSFRSGRFLLQLIGLARAIRRWAPDVVQTYGFYSNLPGLVAAFVARVPVRVAGRRASGKYLRPTQHRIDRWVWRLADRLVANSEAVRRQLIAEEGVIPDKVVAIRNGLDLRPWACPNQPMDSGDEAVVGMVAHFREMKDHTTFLRAAGETLKEVPSARFSLVGSGPLEATIRECARRLGIVGQVEFAGNLEGAALRAAVRRFRVSVLTSKENEGLPNAVLEAMAAGRPVVATAVGGTPEAIEDGVTGFLVPPEDPAQVAERVGRLLKDPSLARSMGERGRQKVEREFTLERMVAEFLALYRHLLRKAG